MTAEPSTSFLCSKFGWVITVSLGTLGAYLLWAHTSHFIAVLPYLILLACPLMHVFGHHHGHGHGHQTEKTK